MEIFSVRVNKITYETEGVHSFELTSLVDEKLPEFTAGAHIDVYLESGLIRQYSLCNGPDESDFYHIAVKKEPASRGGSSEMHDNVHVGDILKISQPRNNFPLKLSSSKYLLIARGVGITPLYSMARHLLSQAIEFELIYFVSSMEKIIFHKEFEIEEFIGKVSFLPAYNDEQVEAYLKEKLEMNNHAHIYTCGSGDFMNIIIDTATQYLPTGAIHKEYFSVASKSPEQSNTEGEFTVELSQSGKSYFIPKGKTIIQVLEESGVEVATSCEQGVCGVCVAKVLSGEPEHEDYYLTEDERAAGELICPCVSRSKSERLILDL